MVDSRPSRRSLFAAGLGLAFGAAGVARPAAAQPIAWPNGARAAVSLTYDDGLNSQLDNVVPELDRHDWKGTFFLTEENAHWRRADWEALARAGHEVANHTMTHPCALAHWSSERFLRSELTPMEGYLDAHFGGERPKMFAYPCGYLGLGQGARRQRFARYKKLLERDGVIAARTTAGAPNRVAEVVADPLRLHAFEPADDADAVGPALHYLNEAVAQGGWAILVFHEVLPQVKSEGDASVATHKRILARIAELDVWCAPMGEVFDYVQSAARRTSGPRIAGR